MSRVNAPPCECGSKRARRISKGPYRIEGREGLFELQGLKCQNCGTKRTLRGKPWPSEGDPS